MADASVPTLTPHERVRVASIAGCDPRVVRFYEQGRPMRSTTLARVEGALRTLGWLERVPRVIAEDPTAKVG